jgi:hypothetical protein
MNLFVPILAQASIPVNSGTVDIISFVTKALDAIVDPTSNTFVATAQPLLDKLGLFALVLGALSWTYGYLTGNHIFSRPDSLSDCLQPAAVLQLADAAGRL